MNDFEREEQRLEQEKDEQEAAELAVLDIKAFARSRCCLFLADEQGEVLHGRLEGLMRQLDTLVLRDLRPGRERLQCRLQVAYEGVSYICHSGALEKCQQCPEYVEMQRQAKRAGAHKPAGRA